VLDEGRPTSRRAYQAQVGSQGVIDVAMRLAVLRNGLVELYGTVSAWLELLVVACGLPAQNWSSFSMPYSSSRSMLRAASCRPWTFHGKE
jgi:hypothetical protein